MLPCEVCAQEQESEDEVPGQESQYEGAEGRSRRVSMEVEPGQ